MAAETMQAAAIAAAAMHPAAVSICNALRVMAIVAFVLAKTSAGRQSPHCLMSSPARGKILWLYDRFITVR
jgi:hypothetical protein